MVYCCVDDNLNQFTQDIPIRSRRFQPSLSDSELLTMEIVAEYQGIDTDKGIWSYFRRHWQHLFPQLLSRSNFVRHPANLWQYKQQLQKQLATELVQYFHGTRESASGQMRAMALLWFHPYGQRTKLKGTERSSPLGELNGFVYHENWLHNLLIAGSMNGSVPRDENLNRIR